ncbi:MAG TPA: hypothetical protein VKU00_26795 [Chthonomonadaceae bacterium]|nr:hypothetical protein [Chthonomonadaceae bacterium]
MERRHVWTSLGVLCLVAFVVLTWVFWPRPRLLLPLSKRITPSFAFPWNVSTSDMAWLSDHEALVVQQDSGGNWKVFRLNTVQHTHVSDAILTKLYQQSQASSPSPYPSPDKKWLLWFTNTYQGIFVSTQDGKQTADFTIRNPQFGGWVDDRHWICYEEHDSNNKALTEVKVYSVDDPKHPHSIHMNGIDSSNWSIMVFPDATHLLTDNWQPDTEAKTLVLTKLELKQGASPITLSRIALPKNDAVNMVTYSPKGERIALVLSRVRNGPFSQLIHRFIPAYPVKTSNVISLYVCNRDGTGMREIGMMMDGGPIDNEAGLDSTSINWLPGEKQLSYVYKGALYTVPVDK